MKGPGEAVPVRDGMILQQIRLHTAKCHENVEEKLGGKLLTPGLTPGGYHKLLTAFYACYQAMEAAAGQTPMIAELLRERSKLPWLERDISYLKQSVPKAQANFPTVTVRGTQDSAMALGMMYVMEGATLGGKHIVNYLLDFDWIELDTCLNFFNSYGNERGKKWKEFTSILEAYAEDHPPGAERILSGASEAFGCIDNAITRV